MLVQNALALSARFIILACLQLSQNLSIVSISHVPVIVLRFLPWEDSGLLHCTSSMTLSLPATTAISMQHVPSIWWVTLYLAMIRQREPSRRNFLQMQINASLRLPPVLTKDLL